MCNPFPRPLGSNADEWAVWLSEQAADSTSYIAVQIAMAIEEAEQRATAHLAPVPADGPQHLAIIRFYEKDHRDAVLAAVRERDRAIERAEKAEADAAEQLRCREMVSAHVDRLINEKIATTRLLDAAKAQRDALAAALNRAAGQFDFYAQQHRAKLIPDVEKAKINEEWAGRCRSAIAPLCLSPAGRQLDQENG